MSFEILQQSPDVAPLLVRLYDTHNLYVLAGAEKENANARYELTTIMSDLLSIQLSDKESELISDVLLSLMKKAEGDLRAALSERLSMMDNIPLRMVLALANDDIAVAEPVLRNSPILGDMDLAYILQAKGVEHGRVIACRKGLGDAIINLLAGTQDFAIAVNLCGNDGIKLTEKTYDILVEMAKGDENVAGPLLARGDLPREIAGRMFDFVGEEMKNVLRARFGRKQAEKAANVIDSLVREMNQKDPAFIENLNLLMAQAHILQQRGELKIPGIVSALRRGQYPTFIVQFSVFCGVPVEMVRTAMRQESGKGLAILCRAVDLEKSDFISMYLLTEKLRNKTKRVITHVELSRLMNVFDAINADDARSTIYATRH